jgi:DNA-binding NarL/FixJ family response regulator
MKLIDQGMSNKEAAYAINIPLDAINNKLHTMFKKAAVKNKTELIKWWRNQNNLT